MISRVETPAPQPPLNDASGNVALVNQTRQNIILNSNQLFVEKQIGKQFQAEVVASLKDGSYIVKVADTAVRMQLPNSPEVSTKLQLTLISTSPRTTFLLNSSDINGGLAAAPGTTEQLPDEFIRSGNAKSSTASTTLNLQSGSNVAEVKHANADPRLTAPTGKLSDSTPATFSSTGKLIDQLLQDTIQQGAVTLSKTPLLSAADVNPGVIAKALQNGVSLSGVFYESHLLQWAEGTLDTAELRKEPQASFISSTKSNNSPENNEKSLINNAAATLSNEAKVIIQQQLQTMEHQRFVWHGELWPGQHMDWEIKWETSRDNPKQQNGQAEKTWQSAVHFELPELGSVSAQLQLNGTHLKLIVNTQNAPTTLTLQQHTSELINALESSGTQLDSLIIKTRQ